MTSSAGLYLDSIRASTQSGRALGAECYLDPEYFKLEVEKVLRPGWHAVARWDDLPEVGDYASLDLFGEPLLIVRDEERRLRVYSRVCRHRAHTVVEGSGNARTLVCPYHRWAYGLDGSLRASPLMSEDARGAEKSGLPELATEFWQGFLLATLNPDPDPIGPSLAPLDARFSSLGLSGMMKIGMLEFDSPWNWKIMVDNFMESYHHLGPHVDSLHASNPAQGTYCAQVEGPFSLLENPAADGVSSFAVWQVFPTLLGFSWDTNEVAGWYEMQIDSCDHLQLRIHLLASPEFAATENAREMVQAALREIHLEDIPVCEGVQRGLASRLWQPGPLSPLEGCLPRFYAYLGDCLNR